MRKKRAVSSSGKQCSFVNLVTWSPVKEKHRFAPLVTAAITQPLLQKKESAVATDCSRISKQACKRKGYESGDDSCGCTHHKGAAKDPQENTHWLEKGSGIKHVCVCTARLVGHNRPEVKKNTLSHYHHFGQCSNHLKEWGLFTFLFLSVIVNSFWMQIQWSYL